MRRVQETAVTLIAIIEHEPGSGDEAGIRNDQHAISHQSAQHLVGVKDNCAELQNFQQKQLKLVDHGQVQETQLQIVPTAEYLDLLQDALGMNRALFSLASNVQ